VRRVNTNDDELVRAALAVWQANADLAPDVIAAAAAGVAEVELDVSLQAAIERVARELSASNTCSQYGPPMTFTSDQITRVHDHTETPDPGMDSTWWRIDLGGRRPGWVYVAASVQPPTEQWIAGELNHLSPRLGHKVLAGRMLGPRGMHLENAPRPE
jgi:hypothetical protein